MKRWVDKIGPSPQIPTFLQTCSKSAVICLANMPSPSIRDPKLGSLSFPLRIARILLRIFFFRSAVERDDAFRTVRKKRCFQLLLLNPYKNARRGSVLYGDCQQAREDHTHRGVESASISIEPPQKHRSPSFFSVRLSQRHPFQMEPSTFFLVWENKQSRWRSIPALSRLPLPEAPKSARFSEQERYLLTENRIP